MSRTYTHKQVQKARDAKDWDTFGQDTVVQGTTIQPQQISKILQIVGGVELYARCS